MKNRSKFLRIIAFVAVIMFTMTACGGDGGDGNETYAQQPTFTLQPQSKVYFPEATAEPLTATASVSDGGSLSYQWYSATNSSGGYRTAIEGEITASYTPPTSTAGTVYYSVVVTNTNQGKTAELRSNQAEIVTGFKEIKNLTAESIAFGGGRFVIGRSSGRTAWSSDGINWTEVDASNVFGNISSVKGIAYGGGRFIAVGGYKMGWSTNGESWTVIDASPAFNGTSHFINNIAYGNNRFFAVGDAARTAYSDDNGQTWTLIDTLTTSAAFGGDSTITNIVYGNNRFIAFTGISFKIAFFDSTAWQGYTINIGEGTMSPRNMIYANNNFIVAGLTKVAKSSNGSTFWTDITPVATGSNTIWRISYGAGRLIVLGTSNNYVAWSDDNGTSWTEMPLERNYSSIAYGNGCFVATSGNSVYYTVYQ